MAIKTVPLVTPESARRMADGIIDHVNAINAVNDIDFALSVIATHVTKLHQHESGYIKAIEANKMLYGIKAYDHWTAAQHGFMIMMISLIMCFTMDTTPFVYIASLLASFTFGYAMNIWCTQRPFLHDKQKIQQSIINTYLYNIDKERNFIDRETKIVQDTYPNLINYLHSDFVKFAKEYLKTYKAADLTKTIAAYDELKSNTNTEEPING